MDRYDVQKVVGQGSYGRAILCRRKKDTKLCIIKQISLAKLSKREAKLTEQEAQLLGRLSHPNIVAFWESFVNNSNLHIVMEYADGGDLDSYVKNYAKRHHGREMPESQVLNLFVQICLAIKHIHDRKILHRDLKGQVSHAFLLFLIVLILFYYLPLGPVECLSYFFRIM
jgi:NIMA (never in mitosis gene a)-related kinase